MYKHKRYEQYSKGSYLLASGALRHELSGWFQPLSYVGLPLLAALLLGDLALLCRTHALASAARSAPTQHIARKGPRAASTLNVEVTVSMVAICEVGSSTPEAS